MNKKPFWKSTTFHGLAIALAGVILHLLVNKHVIGGETAEIFAEFIAYAANLFGLTYAGYGRAKTNGEKLTLGKPKE